MTTLTFKTKLSGTYIFSDCVLVGKDGIGSSVYYGNYLTQGKASSKSPAVMIVNENKLIASCIKSSTCDTLAKAKAKASYAVKNSLKRYWSDNNPMLDYQLHNQDTPILVTPGAGQSKMKSVAKTASARLKQTAAPLPESSYEWFTNQGKTFTVNSTKYGRVQITKGMKFGLRRSSSGSQMRLILEGAPTKVMSLTHEDASRLKLGSDAVKPGPKTKTKLAPGNGPDSETLAVLRNLDNSLKFTGAKVSLLKVEDNVAEFKFAGKAEGFMTYDLAKKRIIDGLVNYKGITLNLFDIPNELSELEEKFKEFKELRLQVDLNKYLLRSFVHYFYPRLLTRVENVNPNL